MKMNAPRRQIVRDAVDLIPHTEVLSQNGEVQIPIAKIRPYYNHPFHLYEGERLDDMVASIRANGVLNPVIVRSLNDGCFEMLAGHNRMNASQMAGLTTIPAIVKTDLTEDEAWLYVMETNLHQRSFDDLAPSEQAAILFLQYDKMSNQGKRSDIARELAILDGTITSDDTENVQPKNSRTPDQRNYENDTISAVGYIDFPEQLPEDQISYYHLIPSNDNPIPGTLASEQPQKNEWKYYIVPDLMTWARPDLEKERTEIEYFDQFDAAVTRFRELRTESYNFEETHSETSDTPYARLTFGIEHDDEFPCAVDLLHVRAGKNVLVEDFTKMELVTESPEAMVILSDLGSQIGFDNVLVNRNMTPDEIKQFTYEHFKFKLEQNGVPQVESYLSSFDQLYAEGQLDNMKPTANQQRISEFKEFTEWDNPYFEVQDTPDRLATDLAVFMTVYDPYTDADKNGAEKYTEIHNNIMVDNTDYLKDWLSSIVMDKDKFSEHAAALSERLEKFSPTQKLMEQSSEISTQEPVVQSESKLTFYVAECSEFPTLGELHENLTLDEAIRIYHEIPSERMNGIKGIGFNLEDGSIYDGQMDLMSGGVVHTDIINAIDHYRENPEIQQAMEKLKSVFDVPEYDQTHDPQEAVFEINDNYLHIQSASDSSWDYTYYNPSMEVIDGGQIGDESMRFSQARSKILSLLDIPDAPLKPIPIEEFEDMLDAHENDFHCPVYHKDLKQAREDGEMDKWRISHNATMACAEQFRNGYERAYENRQVPQFLQQIIDRYGMADQDATIYTHDKKMIARLEKLSAKFPDDFKRKSQSPSGDATYIFPKKYLSIREPYSEARRQAARERALKGNMKPPKRSKNP